MARSIFGSRTTRSSREPAAMPSSWEHERLSGRDQAKARGKVEGRMKEVAGELKRDPQLESLLRSRSKELGIEAGSRLDRVVREPNIERAISHGIRRHRGLGMSM